jgi:hypothetical protein
LTPSRAPLLLLLAAGCSAGLEPRLEPNPVCDISAVMRWSTRKPASSWVEVSQGGEPLFRVGSDALVEEHEVIVVGMHAEGDYQLEAVSVTEGGDALRSGPWDFTTGSLPYEFLQGELTAHQPDLVEPGWVLTNVMTASYGPVILELLDEQGQVVWYYVHEGEDGGADIQPSWYPELGQVLVGPHLAGGESPYLMDLKGEVSWTGPEQPGDPDALNIQDGQLHHAMFRLDDGDFVAVRSRYQPVDGEPIQGDEVIRLDPAGEVVWSWNAFDHIAFDPDDLYLGLWWTHLNAVHWDEEAGVAYINSWVLGSTWKVDLASGEILWTLGEGGDFSAPDNPEPWFAYAHAVELLDNGNLLLHDNGSMERGWSRVVEYALDESTMSARIVWEYTGELAEDAWFVPSCGDVDQLPGGNRLVVAHKRILELTPQGEKAWEYTWDHVPDEAPDLRSYQAEKIEALVEAL